MASIYKADRGSYYAQWYSSEGKPIKEATGEYEYERAMKEANRREATSRFWEYHAQNQWQAFATLSFSPRYCFDNFTHAKHLRYDQFKKLLIEAKVKFAPAKKWRDRPKTRTNGGKRYSYRGRSMTLSEIIDWTGSTLNEAALKFRIQKGWSIEDAVNKPLLTRAEAGTMGANKTNQSRAHAPTRHAEARDPVRGGGGALGPSPTPPPEGAKTPKRG